MLIFPDVSNLNPVMDFTMLSDVLRVCWFCLYDIMGSFNILGLSMLLWTVVFILARLVIRYIVLPFYPNRKEGR